MTAQVTPLDSVDYWRQLGIIEPDRLNVPVTIIGAGGIGSPTALALAKMGIRDLTIWDHDGVESHNLPNQLYRKADLGSPKVTALADIIGSFTNASVTVHQTAYEGDRLSGIVISAVDTMATRTMIWNAVKTSLITVPLYIDARMGGEFGDVYAVNPTDLSSTRRYAGTLYTDEESADIPCTAQAIIYTVFFMAAVIAGQVKKYCAGEEQVFRVTFDLFNMAMYTE